MTADVKVIALLRQTDRASLCSQLFLHLVVHRLLLALMLYVSRLLFVQASNGSSLYLHRHPHLR
jgi:hypothetical protein